MSTEAELYEKANALFSDALDEQDETVQQHKLLSAFTFFQKAIRASVKPLAEYYSKAAYSLYLLNEWEKAAENAKEALKRDRFDFRAYYTLYVMALAEFEQRGGFTAKAKTKVNWLWMAIAAIFSPDALSDRIGEHYGKKIGSGITSREAGNKLTAAYTGILECFKYSQGDVSKAVSYADMLLNEATNMQAAGYPVKNVYTVVAEGLSALTDCGDLEDEARELQARAEGWLEINA